MGAQKHLVVHVEGILHIPCGVVGRQIEEGEVVFVILHLGALEGGEAEAHERVPYLAIDEGKGVKRPRADRLAHAGKGHVYRLALYALLLRELCKLSLARFEPFRKLLLDGVRALAQLRPFLGGKLAHGTEDGGKLAAPAQNGGGKLVERIGFRNGLELSKRRLAYLFQFFEHIKTPFGFSK